MRLISEDGMVDVPYESVALELRKNDAANDMEPESWEIIAFHPADPRDESWVMGVYFNEEDARLTFLHIRLAFQRSCHWFEFGETRRRRS